jgi:hypothetical protein
MTHLDRGTFVKNSIVIEPCANGSYMVRQYFGPDNTRYVALADSCMGFSNWRDLVMFLSDDYEMANQSGAQPPTESPDI